MDLKRALATNLVRERNDRGLTQEALADLAGISYRYLGSIERGRVAISITVLGKLAEALRIDAGQLIATKRKG